MYDPIPGATGQCPADCRLSHGLRCNPQRRASRYLGNTGRNWPATSPGHLENTGKSYLIVIKLAFFWQFQGKNWTGSTQVWSDGEKTITQLVVKTKLATSEPHLNLWENSTYSQTHGRMKTTISTLEKTPGFPVLDVLWCLHQDQLVDIRDIAASDLAFAAVRADGRVVTWGHGRAGSDSLAVQAELKSLAGQWNMLGICWNDGWTNLQVWCFSWKKSQNSQNYLGCQLVSFQVDACW